MNYIVDVPFPIIRTFLPTDGERLSFLIGSANKWPKNPTPFLRDETMEIAFGLAIRSNPDDRHDQQVMSPGISCVQDVLVIQGGWAAHKDVTFHDDFFDGTFSCNVYFVINSGHVLCELRDFNLTWRADWFTNVTGLSGIITDFAKSKVQNEIQKKIMVLNDILQRMIQDVRTQYPKTPIASNDVSLSLLPGVFRIVVNVS